MAKAPTGKKAAAKGGTSLATQSSNVPAEMLGALHEHAGEGMEKVSIDDVIMPRLKILQALSPECNRRKPEYIEGAEPGKIVNVATRRLYDRILVVPAAYIRHHVEWLPNRGGFVADHGDDASIMDKVTHRDEKFNDILPNGNVIQPTPTWYCILMEEGGEPCVIPMPRTQSKASRSWMSQATSEKLNHPEHGQFTAPLFYRSWYLSTMERSNDDGDWFVWAVERGPSIADMEGDEPVLPTGTMEKAQNFRKMVTSGEVKASADHFADDEQSGGGSRGGGSSDNSAM